MLAIVIPYYKRKFFKDTLQSLSTQTNLKFKVYVGDDASPENCEDLIHAYSKCMELIYTRFETNLGGTNLVAQWIRCLAMVKEEPWIQILGDDDIVSENFVASFYDALPNINKNNCNVVRLSTYVINAEGERISKQFKHPVLELAPLFFERKFKKDTRSSLSEYIFKKSIVLKKEFKTFNLAWHTDDMAVFEFSDLKPIYSINKAFVSVRVSEINITGNSDHFFAKNEGTFQFMEKLFSTYSTHFSIAQKKLLLTKLEMAYHNIPSSTRYFRVVKLYFEELGIYCSFDFIIRNFKNNIARVLKKLYLFDFVKKVTRNIDVFQ